MTCCGDTQQEEAAHAAIKQGALEYSALLRTRLGLLSNHSGANVIHPAQRRRTAHTVSYCHSGYKAFARHSTNCSFDTQCRMAQGCRFTSVQLRERQERLQRVSPGRLPACGEIWVTDSRGETSGRRKERSTTPHLTMA